jgi:predicted dienelactone hydrolase
MGVAELQGLDGDGPVTVFHPTAAADQAAKRGPFTLQLAENAPPARGNERLVVISHGSGGSAWPHADLARALVEAGYIVALPEHAGDNYKDTSGIGPASWRKRPLEVSRAIDAVAKDSRFAPLLKLDKVGMYGMSAGGHTALTLAGGRWAPALVARHCQLHIREDFSACSGLTTRLTGGWADSFKIWTVLAVINMRFADPVPVGHTDPRVQAIVAAVPYAADFDMTTLAKPAVPLGLVIMGQDKWLKPAYHGEAVLKACTSCATVANLPEGGHGSTLSPFPPKLSEAAAELLNDPPGFDRRKMADVDRKIVEFFKKHL